MFAISRHPRRLAAALLTVFAWVAASVVVSASAALAKVGPDDASFVTQTRTVTVTAVDWNQLAITAAAACAVGIAATLAVQLVFHRAHGHSMAHA
jgi:hypothetical protein